MLITLHPEAETPLFQQIHDRILEAIARGEMPRGTRLDSVRRVSAEFGINPATVKKAYDLLGAEGIIETSQRAGSVVAAPGVPRPAQLAHLREELGKIATLAHAQGFDKSTIHAELDSALDQLTDNKA